MTDKEASVRLELANLFVAIGAKCSINNFEILLTNSIKLCEDPSPHTRSAAASAIGNF